MTLSIIKTYSSDNIDVLNEKLWRDIYYDGNPLVFGSENEPKAAREVFAVIQLYGKALDDLYTGKLPKGWKFGEAANKVYIEMLKDPERGEQPYTYGERLHYQVTSISTEMKDKNGTPFLEWHNIQINQLHCHKEMLQKSIESGIQSNRIWGDIGKPTDLELKDPPCFRGWQLRTSEIKKVSLRIIMRSSDAGNAYAANLGGFIRVFVDEVIEPAGGILEEVIFVALSEHLYKNDSDMIEAVVGNIPEHIRRLLK